MPSSDPEFERVLALIEGRTYFSNKYTASRPEQQLNGRYVAEAQGVDRVLDDTRNLQFQVAGHEITLHISQRSRLRLQAVFLRDSKDVISIVVQSFDSNGKPVGSGISLSEGEAAQFARLINAIAVADDKDEHVRLDEETFSVIINDSAELRRFFDSGGANALVEFVKSDSTSSDLIAVCRRKEQLDIFHRMLEDDSFFEEQRAEHNGPERAWQSFFEQNQWIFGYGLNYIYLDSWDNARLEQVTSGNSVSAVGKRVDALLETTGLISSLCFAEIKTHQTPLLQGTKRSGVWTPSLAITEAVAQIQRTVDQAREDIRSRLEHKDEDGNFTGRRSHYVQPRSFLLIGTLAEMCGDREGTENEEKFRSFELYRQNTATPEIITFDELYERARHIVEPGIA